MAETCANRDCENDRATGLEFCPNCSAKLATDKADLFPEMLKWLRLHGEFVVWCSENGHPNPHE